jgi:hypothetical protein
MVATKIATHIAGRHMELQEIRSVLDNVIQTRNTALVLVEGEGGACKSHAKPRKQCGRKNAERLSTGMGKSAIVAEFLAGLPAKKLAEPLVTTGDGQENKTPYFPFRTIFETVTGIAGAAALQLTCVQLNKP